MGGGGILVLPSLHVKDLGDDIFWSDDDNDPPRPYPSSPSPPFQKNKIFIVFFGVCNTIRTR